MTTEVPLYSFQGSLSSSGSWTTYEPDTTRKTARLSTTLSSLVRKTLNKSDKRTLRLLTFNIWFDAFFKAERALAVIRIIEELEPDVCCFQEVTPQFEEALRTSKHFQRYWALTGLDDQLQLTGFGYGTLIAVKRDLFDTTGVFKDPKVYHVKFIYSTTGRCLTVLDVGMKNAGDSRLLLSTSHLDYTPALRKEELELTVQTLSQSPFGQKVIGSLFCGDTNIEGYHETNPLLQADYVDAWLATHPNDATASDLLRASPTYGETGVIISGTTPKEPPNIRRLDLVISKGPGLTAQVAQLVGETAIPKKDLKGAEGVDLNGVTVYPSDHKGVMVDFEMVTPP